MCTKNKNFMMYGSWNYKVWRTELSIILSFFLPFDSPNNQKKKKIFFFEKMKTTPGDIFILYLSTTNGNYMMYGSWDMECNRHNFLSLWSIFWPFIPLTTRKIKILGKWKEHLEISSVYTWVPQIDKLCTTDRFFHHVGLFFWIKWKNVWRYCHFTHVYHKWETYDAWFLRHRAWQNFFSFCTIFCPFTPWEPGKPKFW